MIEIDIDPNYPDRRPGASGKCAVATNLSLRDGAHISQLYVGDRVIVVQDHAPYNEPDWVAPGVVDDIQALEGSQFGITHFIYIDVAWDEFADRVAPEG